MSAMSSPIEIDDEAAVVAQARLGDAKAFSELLRRYDRKIFRLAMHITQNREDAEDVLQETFLKAYEHLDQFQGQSKFYTWIVRIAVNQALMKLRKRKSDRSVSLDETIDTGEDNIGREIAAWDENPEQQYSREELNGILTQRGGRLGADLSRRLRAARYRRAFDRGNRRSAGAFGPRCEEPPAARPAAASR